MGNCLGGYQSEGRGRKERIGVKKMDVLYIERESEREQTHQTLVERGKDGEGEWEDNGGGELVEGTLYTCTELSQ
jgi:hypothetical protein